MRPNLIPLAFVALLLAASDRADASSLSALMADGMGVLRDAAGEGKGALLLEAPASLADDPAVTTPLSETATTWHGVEWVSPFLLNRAAREEGANVALFGSSPRAVARFLTGVTADRLLVVKLTPQGNELFADFILYDATGEETKRYKSLVRLTDSMRDGKPVVIGIGPVAPPPAVAPQAPVVTLDGLIGGLAPVELSAAVGVYVGVENRIALYRLDGNRFVPLGETMIDEPVRIAGLFLRDGKLYVNGLINGVVHSRIYNVAPDGALASAADDLPYFLIDGGADLYGRRQNVDRSLSFEIDRLTEEGGSFAAAPFATVPETLPVAGVAIDGSRMVAIDERQSLILRSSPGAPFEKIGEGFGGSSLFVPRKSIDEAPALFTFSPPPLIDGATMIVVRNERESGFIPTAGYAAGSVALLRKGNAGWRPVASSPTEEGPVTSVALLPDRRIVVARHRPSPFGGAGVSTLLCSTLSAP